MWQHKIAKNLLDKPLPTSACERKTYYKRYSGCVCCNNSVISCIFCKDFRWPSQWPAVAHSHFHWLPDFHIAWEYTYHEIDNWWNEMRMISKKGKIVNFLQNSGHIRFLIQALHKSLLANGWKFLLKVNFKPWTSIYFTNEYSITCSCLTEHVSQGQTAHIQNALELQGSAAHPSQKPTCYTIQHLQLATSS